MRVILLDWMTEVCQEFLIKRDTFYTAMNFVDRYLSVCQYEVPKSELQLIGVTSLFLASKIEEIFIPKVSDFALATDGGYTSKQIMEMEH